MSVSPYSSAALKRSALHFLTGKAASGMLTLVILLLLVRVLTVEEYGIYVILVAGMELVLAITSLGLPWTVARYLPEFRLCASGTMLAHFVWQAMALISLFLVIGILLLLWILPWLLSSMGLAQFTDVARLYLLVMLLEGLGRNIQDNALGPLLQQGWVQISLVVRNLALLLLLGIVVTQGMIHLYQVVLAELAASALGAVLALCGLVRYLHKNCDLSKRDDWQPPAWSEMWSIARYMYFSHLITLIYSPQVFVFFVQRYLGVDAAALFGFLRSLFGQISRYLPATLLFGLIRPKLVASYVNTGDMLELKRNANLVGKLSLFVLMPFLVFAWLAGDELLNFLSGDKFNQTGYYLAFLLLALIPFSQRQILGTVVVISDKSHLSIWGATLSTLVLPLAYWLLEAGMGLWSFIIAIIFSHMIHNAVLIIGLMLSTTYRPDNIGFFKLAAAALVGFILVRQLEIPVNGWLDLLIMAVLASSSFLLTAYFIKPFQMEERSRLNRLLNRKIFAW
ncbi:MAG: oligosaccharide flippase family protein [Nitrosomonas sp.]|uniref:lipopolysaccharide biosynthesis protein n=1 Tax=Nitrosomonas sp. TaxID=42353 RepID=UPI0027372146|nr:oligosaccharide flippase family protein [Nitrosomonas sp.]MDP3282681.1 oligosaccharide flippase family protein [Nitrosomonas sp.]MDP3662409.1 oligosaccharide flippase family protein [Nitrosomonas sp.]MDZ4106560.1 oligosaccharide flippase family protein [Nitrosomonas sp.]